MPDRRREVVVLLGEFPEHILCARIPWINFQFLLELSFRLRNRLGCWLRLGQQRPAETRVNAAQERINFQDPAIFSGRLVPLPLQFQSLGVQFVNLI